MEAPIDQLLLVRRSLLAAQDTLDMEAKTLAKQDARCELLQNHARGRSADRVGFSCPPSTVSARFAKSSALGAYLGLTPRGHQSGAVSWTGRISKAGDALTRALLYEAANVLMVRVKAWPPLKRARFFVCPAISVR